MKKGIHPENYRTVLFYDSNAKQGFLIRSCAKKCKKSSWLQNCSPPRCRLCHFENQPSL